MEIRQIKAQPPLDVRHRGASDKSRGLGCAVGDWWGLGRDAGEDRYVTFETLQKPFSQVSESQESGAEIWRCEKKVRQIKCAANKQEHQVLISDDEELVDSFRRWGCVSVQLILRSMDLGIRSYTEGYDFHVVSQEEAGWQVQACARPPKLHEPHGLRLKTQSIVGISEAGKMPLGSLGWPRGGFRWTSHHFQSHKTNHVFIHITLLWTLDLYNCIPNFD